MAGPLALAFPTANPHSSSRGGLPFSASQWAALAAEVREAGLTPLATGLPDLEKDAFFAREIHEALVETVVTVHSALRSG